MNLKGRNFLTLKDFTPEEIQYLLDLSADLKDKKKKGIPVDIHKGKNVALIFEKTSTRTRCAFEVEPLIWIQLVPRLAKRRALQILQEFLDGCMRASSTVDMVRPS